MEAGRWEGGERGKYEGEGGKKGREKTHTSSSHPSGEGF